MRSSSRLFPVSLMAADWTGHLSEDVYQLNPGKSKDPSVRLMVTRITDPSWKQPRRPIILLHGEFRNRRDFISPEGEGLAARLAELGFDVWLPEMRGHGLTPANDRESSNRLLHYALEDWPEVHRFVMEQDDGHSPVWVAAGLGAQSLAYSLIHVPEMAQRTAGAVFVDPGSEEDHWVWRTMKTMERWRVLRKRFIDGMRRGWGTEREPVMLLREQRHWQMAGTRGHHPVHDRLRRIAIPSLTVTWADSEEAGRRFLGRLGGRNKSWLPAREAGAPEANPGDATLWPVSVARSIEHWLIEGRLDQKKAVAEKMTG